MSKCLIRKFRSILRTFVFWGFRQFWAVLSHSATDKAPYRTEVCLKMHFWIFPVGGPLFVENSIIFFIPSLIQSLCKINSSEWKEKWSLNLGWVPKILYFLGGNIVPLKIAFPYMSVWVRVSQNLKLELTNYTEKLCQSCTLDRNSSSRSKSFNSKKLHNMLIEIRYELLDKVWDSD